MTRFMQNRLQCSRAHNGYYWITLIRHTRAEASREVTLVTPPPPEIREKDYEYNTIIYGTVHNLWG